jgi:hypothetical protein
MSSALTQQTQEEFQKQLTKRQEDLAAGRENKLFSQRVEIKHGDGSLFQLNYASMLESGPYLFVFSEHNGALGFFLDDLDSYQYLNNRFAP